MPYPALFVDILYRHTRLHNGNALEQHQHTLGMHKAHASCVALVASGDRCAMSGIV